MYYYPSVLYYTVQLPFFPFFGRSGGEFLNIFFSLKKLSACEKNKLAMKSQKSYYYGYLKKIQIEFNSHEGPTWANPDGPHKGPTWGPSGPNVGKSLRDPRGSSAG